jgi:hypothetical protein
VTGTQGPPEGSATLAIYKEKIFLIKLARVSQTAKGRITRKFTGWGAFLFAGQEARRKSSDYSPEG